MKLHLTGSRNQCPGCDKYFNSNSAFDKHRVGTPGKDRHCRTTEEMEAAGMFVNADGFWVGEVNFMGAAYYVKHKAATREATEGCREGNNSPTGAAPPNVPPRERFGEGTTTE